MNSQSVIIYVMKTILIAGIFVAYYWLALRNKKLHYYNRFYLLFSLLLSIVLPLVNFTWIKLEKPVSYGTGKILNFILTAGESSVRKVWNMSDWSLLFVIAVSSTMLLLLLISIMKIYRLKRNSVVTQMGDIDFIETEDENAPFSFLKNLFWKKSIPMEQGEGKKILKHELTHIHQKHTIDRLFCQLLCSLIWINPFYWIIQKELLTIHEFIADEEAIGNSDPESFAKMLLQTHYGNHFLQETQSFFYSSIKRRLIMLTTSKNTRYSYVRRLIALPLLVLTISIFSFRVNAKEENKITNREKLSFLKTESSPIFLTGSESKKNLPALKIKTPVRAPFSIKENSDTVAIPTQEAPKFPGGSDGWRQFLNEKTDFAKLVKKGAPSGKYEVQLSFIVDKDGDVRDVTALNDPGYGSKEDAMRVLLSSPKWEPATQNGKKVIYRNTISITYLVSAN